MRLSLTALCCVLSVNTMTAHDRVNDPLRRHGTLRALFKTPVAQAVQTVARDHSFHPVRAYLDNLRWDGVERLDGWLSRLVKISIVNHHGSSVRC
jgi:predicted P-loop ATPase